MFNLENFDRSLSFFGIEKDVPKGGVMALIAPTQIGKTIFVNTMLKEMNSKQRKDLGVLKDKISNDDYTSALKDVSISSLDQRAILLEGGEYDSMQSIDAAMQQLDQLMELKSQNLDSPLKFIFFDSLRMIISNAYTPRNDLKYYSNYKDVAYESDKAMASMIYKGTSIAKGGLSYAYENILSDLNAMCHKLGIYLVVVINPSSTNEDFIAQLADATRRSVTSVLSLTDENTITMTVRPFIKNLQVGSFSFHEGQLTISLANEYSHKKALTYKSDIIDYVKYAYGDEKSFSKKSLDKRDVVSVFLN